MPFEFGDAPKKGFTEDEICSFGEPLLETHCNKYAYHTIGYQDDLDDQCYRAVHGIMHGKTLAEVQNLVSLEHPGGAGAQAILADLYAWWHAPIA